LNLGHLWGEPNMIVCLLRLVGNVTQGQLHALLLSVVASVTKQEKWEVGETQQT